MIPTEQLPDEAIPDGMDARLEAEQAWAAVERLPPAMRDVFRMRVDGGMAFRDIGRLLGHTENWACVTYHRARARLREEWEEEP